MKDDRLTELRKLINERIKYEESVTRIPYISQQRVIAYKRVLVDITKLQRQKEINNETN